MIALGSKDAIKDTVSTLANIRKEGADVKKGLI
jgi:hypothetical protein